MRLLLMVLAIIFTAAIAYLVYENSRFIVPIAVYNAYTFPLTLGVIILLSAVLGVAAAVCFSMRAQYSAQDVVRRSTLRQEKAQVQAEISTDQVRVLEAKVQTLERALASALSSQNAEG